MGTRSVTTVRSRWGNTGDFEMHATVYRHYDGYLRGHGAWLAHFLENIKVMNGKGGDWDETRHVNGPGRLAARLVIALDEDGHDPDLMPHDTDCGQEYHYQISVDFGMNGGDISVAVFDGPMTFFGDGGDECVNKIFEGNVYEYGAFISKETADVKS